MRAVEWLRPLVESMSWDYVVVWKLGDDPSRFIEWVGCCCCGGKFDGVKQEDNGGGEAAAEGLGCYSTTTLCRDLYRQHLMWTKACQELALFPSSLPLYSGVHGEVVISNRPKWICHATTSTSNSLPEPGRTRVLIPVVGGIIELFSAGHIQEDPNIIKLVMKQCRFFDEEASYPRIGNGGTDELVIEELLKGHSLPLYLPSSESGLQLFPVGAQCGTYPSLEGSSNSSNLSNECTSCVSYSMSGYLPQGTGAKQSPDESTASKDVKSLSQQPELLGCGVGAGKDKAIRKMQGGKCQAKNLITERNRRHRIKDGLFTLRSLVPKISKMDMAAIIVDAVGYIGELQNEAKKLEEELSELEEEEQGMKNADMNPMKLNDRHECTKRLAAKEDDRPESSCLDPKRDTEVQVEVNQIGKRNLLVKLILEQKQGWFLKLMEGMNSLGIVVVDANITTLNGKVMANLMLEVGWSQFLLSKEGNKKDGLPKRLRDSLVKLAISINE